MKKIILLLFAVSLHAEEPAAAYLPAVHAKPILRTTTTSAGQPIVYPKTDQPEVTALLVEIPAGAETGWHKHPFPCYGYILSGELDVEIKGGKINHFKVGDALVEAVDVLHNGRNNGAGTVKLVMFVTGEKGQPFTVKAAK